MHGYCYSVVLTYFALSPQHFYWSHSSSLGKGITLHQLGQMLHCCDLHLFWPTLYKTSTALEWSLLWLHLGSMYNCWQSCICRLPGAWCQSQVHNSGLQSHDITLSIWQPDLLSMPCFMDPSTSSFCNRQDQFTYCPSRWLWYMHHQEVVLCTSCDTGISLLLKILLSALSWHYSRDAISFSDSYSNVWLVELSLPLSA